MRGGVRPPKSAPLCLDGYLQDVYSSTLKCLWRSRYIINTCLYLMRYTDALYWLMLLIMSQPPRTINTASSYLYSYKGPLTLLVKALFLYGIYLPLCTFSHFISTNTSILINC